MDIFERIAYSYRHAHSSNYSACWDKAHYEHFDSLILRPEVWREFQANGLAEGMGNSRNFDDGGRTVPNEFTDPQTIRIAEDWYRELVGMAGETYVSGLMETGIGCPPVAIVGGKRIALHDLRLIYNAWRLQPFLDRTARMTILEIGAGYGGLPYKLKNSSQTADSF